jgi:hypothetical protein
MKYMKQFERWIQSGFSKSETPSTEAIHECIMKARLGEALTKAFSQAYNVNPSHVYVRGALLNEEMLIEWAEEVE